MSNTPRTDAVYERYVVEHDDNDGCASMHNLAKEFEKEITKLKADNERLKDVYRITKGGEHLMKTVIRLKSLLRELNGSLEDVLSIETEEKRMQKEYPAGTCNAEDAWKEFFDEKQKKKQKANEVLKMAKKIISE